MTEAFRIDPGPGGVDLEKVSGSAVSVGVQHDADRVVPGHVAISSHGVDGNAARVRIFARESKIEPIAGHEDPDFRFIECGLTRSRCLLYEFQHGRIQPRWFIQ